MFEINAESLISTSPRRSVPLTSSARFPAWVKGRHHHWCREEIARLNKEIERMRSEIKVDYKNYPAQSSAFILFNTRSPLTWLPRRRLTTTLTA